MNTSRLARLVAKLPPRVQTTVERWLEIAAVFGEIKDPKVARSLGPAGLRGLVLQRGKQGKPSLFQASHEAYFDWTYPADQPEITNLYTHTKRGQ